MFLPQLGVTDLLEEGGELLGHVALRRLVPQGDLLDGVLQELGHLQFDPQLSFQPLLLSITQLRVRGGDNTSRLVLTNKTHSALIQDAGGKTESAA